MQFCVERYERSSHLFGSLLEENACSGRPLLPVCIYPSWPFLGSHRFDVGLGLEGVFICNLMRIGRWSEQSVDSVCQEHEVMRDTNANETSVDLVCHFSSSCIGRSRVP